MRKLYFIVFLLSFESFSHVFFAIKDPFKQAFDFQKKDSFWTALTSAWDNTKIQDNRIKVVQNALKFSPTNTSSPAKKTISKTAEPLFVVPDVFKNDVDFWAKVYREWDTNQVVFYDSKTKIVYDILNLPQVPNELSSRVYRKDVEKRLKQLSYVLTNVRDVKKSDQQDEIIARVMDVVRKHGLFSEKDLALRLKQQSGLRSQFEYGLRSSGRYEDDMKSILRAQGLPEELIAIVYVESLFYLSALSHAGASGLWGFLKETAINSGIYVNNFTDERLDPVTSTWGAARYLGKAKELLKEWPLAITSYNYGVSGMMRAVNNLGTRDYAVIANEHSSPLFQYAAKSYFPEVVAAVDTIQNHERYFPGVKKDPPWKYELVTVSRPVDVADLIAYSAISKEDLLQLNPALTKRTIIGHEVIPPDFALRVPKGSSKHFYTQVKKIPAHKREAASNKISTKFIAKGKQSLEKIARSFGISSTFLQAKLGKPSNYQPKGPVLIRSQAHLFSPLSKLNEVLLDGGLANELNTAPGFNFNQE